MLQLPSKRVSFDYVSGSACRERTPVAAGSQLARTRLSLACIMMFFHHFWLLSLTTPGSIPNF
jgi:hypothetical protein